MGTPNSRKGSGAAEAPDLEGADQGLRLVDSRGEASHNATMQQASSLATSDCQLSLQGSKSFTWVETSRHRDKELKSNDGCDGRLERSEQ
jgi:hypothetical protein